MPLTQKPKATNKTRVPNMLSCFGNFKTDLTQAEAEASAQLTKEWQSVLAEVRELKANLPKDEANFEVCVKNTGAAIEEDLVAALTVIDKLCAQLDTWVKALIQFLTQLEIIIPAIQPQLMEALLVLQALDYGLQGEQALGAYALQTMASAKSVPLTAANASSIISAAQTLVPQIDNAMVTAQRLRILSPSVNTTQITSTLNSTLSNAAKEVNVVAAGEAALNTAMAASSAAATPLATQSSNPQLRTVSAPKMTQNS